MKGRPCFLEGWHDWIIFRVAERSLSCHLSNELLIHRTKLEKADELYQNHAGELLTPPRPEQMDAFPKLVPHEFSLKEPKMDIVFSGLGWVTVNEPGARVVAHVPKGVHVMVRKSLIYKMKVRGEEMKKVYAVIGDPIAHSMSPAIQNDAFKKEEHGCGIFSLSR